MSQGIYVTHRRSVSGPGVGYMEGGQRLISTLAILNATVLKSVVL